MHRFIIIAVSLVALFILTSTPPTEATLSGCGRIKTKLEPGETPYPPHSLSPLENLQHHELVFFGEVVVPARPCSLGYCAGIRIHKSLKGKSEANVLVQVQRPNDSQCPPIYFNEKGEQWLVFGNYGTSRSGMKYLYAEDEGASFPSNHIPNFEALEAQYHQMRTNLDTAIETSLNRKKSLR